MLSAIEIIRRIADPSKYASKRDFFDKVKAHFDKKQDREYITVCIDIVGFRLYNEKFGVDEGDRFLLYMAEKIKHFVHPGSGVIAVCYASTDKFFMCYEADRFDTDTLLFELKEIFKDWEIKYDFSVRLGLVKTDGNTDPAQNCEHAQIAVNSIKGDYGKMYAYYTQEMLERVVRDDEMNKAMSKALMQGEFVPFFQPQVNAETRKIEGAELLVRWISPKKGFISPGEFIPLFEKNGNITVLDMYLWSMGCTLLRKWKNMGFDNLHISVNVSRTDFYHPGIADYLKDTVEKKGLSPKDVHVEITESAYFENYKQFRSVLNKFIEYGFTLEIDDFGSGYSSLNMLNDVPFEVVKLDKEFIEKDATERGKLLLTCIVEMIKKLGMSIVCEGIETEDQYNFVKSIGCDVIQGYYFSKPLPVRDFEKLLEART